MKMKIESTLHENSGLYHTIIVEFSLPDGKIAKLWFDYRASTFDPIDLDLVLINQKVKK